MHRHQGPVFEAFEDPVDAAPVPADQFGEVALAEVHDAVLGPADEDEGDLGFEVAGEKLDHPVPETRHPAGDGVQPPPGETGSLLQEAVEAERVDREDEAVFQGHGIPRTRIRRKSEMSPTTSPGRRIWRTALHLKIEIKPDNRVYAEGPRQDIGQGFLTTFAMQVADHLDVPIENMDVICSPAEQKRGAAQITGGSHNTRALWDPIRVIALQ